MSRTFLQRERAAHVVAQRITFQELHDQIGPTIGKLAEVDDVDDVFVADEIYGPGLVEKSLHDVRLPRVLVM